MSHAGGVMGALQHAHIFRGHIGPSLSSGFAAAALRFAPPGDNAGPTRPLPAMLLLRKAGLDGRLCAAKAVKSQKPEPRGAVNVREAAWP